MPAPPFSPRTRHELSRPGAVRPANSIACASPPPAAPPPVAPAAAQPAVPWGRRPRLLPTSARRRTGMRRRPTGRRASMCPSCPATSCSATPTSRAKTFAVDDVVYVARRRQARHEGRAVLRHGHQQGHGPVGRAGAPPRDGDPEGPRLLDTVHGARDQAGAGEDEGRHVGAAAQGVLGRHRRPDHAAADVRRRVHDEAPDDPSAELAFHFGGADGGRRRRRTRSASTTSASTTRSTARRRSRTIAASPACWSTRSATARRCPRSRPSRRVQDAAAWELLEARGEVAVASGETSRSARTWRRATRCQIADFSAYAVKGTGYTLKVGDDTSHPFDIGNDIYKKLKYDALAYFYHNRSGIAIEMPYAGDPKWARPAGHIGVKPNKATTRAVRDRQRLRLHAGRHAAAGTTPATTASTWSTAASRCGRCSTSTSARRRAAPGALRRRQAEHPREARTACPTCWTRRAGRWSSCSRCRCPRGSSWRGWCTTRSTTRSGRRWRCAPRRGPAAALPAAAEHGGDAEPGGDGRAVRAHLADDRRGVCGEVPDGGRAGLDGRAGEPGDLSRRTTATAAGPTTTTNVERRVLLGGGRAVHHDRRRPTYKDGARRRRRLQEDAAAGATTRRAHVDDLGPPTRSGRSRWRSCPSALPARTSIDASAREHRRGRRRLPGLIGAGLPAAVRRRQERQYPWGSNSFVAQQRDRPRAGARLHRATRKYLQRRRRGDGLHARPQPARPSLRHRLRRKPAAEPAPSLLVRIR